jgi:hypothetical protein
MKRKALQQTIAAAGIDPSKMGAILSLLAFDNEVEKLKDTATFDSLLKEYNSYPLDSDIGNETLLKALRLAKTHSECMKVFATGNILNFDIRQQALGKALRLSQTWDECMDVFEAVRGNDTEEPAFEKALVSAGEYFDRLFGIYNRSGNCNGKYKNAVIDKLLSVASPEQLREFFYSATDMVHKDMCIHEIAKKIK